eukprot:7315738-Pyramimonas_sp.AAC.2
MPPRPNAIAPVPPNGATQEHSGNIRTHFSCPRLRYSIPPAVGGDMDYDMSSEEIQYVLAHLFCRLVETNTDGLVSLEDLMEM